MMIFLILDDIYALIQILVYFGDDEYAEKIQHCMEELLLTIEKSKSEIWNKSAPSSLIEMVYVKIYN